MIEIILWLLPYLLISLEIGLLSGTVGSYIYMRRLSGIVGGLAHFILGPIGVSYVIGHIVGRNTNPFIFSMVFMIIVALILPIDTKGRIKAENEIQVLWSIGMATGLLIMFLLPGYLNLDIFLFGSILTISRINIIIITIITVLVLTIEFVFHNRFKFLGLDDDFLLLRGISPHVYHRIQLIIIVLTITILLESIGILLLIAILIIPAASTSLLVSRSRSLVLVSMVIAIVGLILGIIMSYVFNLQISSITTLILGGCYFVCRFISIRRKLS